MRRRVRDFGFLGSRQEKPSLESRTLRGSDQRRSRHRYSVAADAIEPYGSRCGQVKMEHAALENGGHNIAHLLCAALHRTATPGSHCRDFWSWTRARLDISEQ